jgi:hypothetical protein
MAFEDPFYCPPGLVAGADLSAQQFRFVKLNATGQVVACSVAGESAFGVLQDKPDAAGRAASVATLGVSKVLAGATIAPNDLVATDAQGRAVPAVKASTNTADAGAASDPLVASHVQGVAMTGGALGQLISVDLQKMGAVPTTSA